MSFNVAVATDNGKDINQHFGKTKQFYIYQVELDGSYEQVSIRNVDIDNLNDCFSSSSCKNGHGCSGGGCNPHDYLSSTIKLIDDCKYLLASKIGKGIENNLKKYDITSFSIELPISEAIQKIVIYENRLNKFKNNGGL